MPDQPFDIPIAMAHRSREAPNTRRLALALAALLTGLGGQALALEPQKNEEELLKACEQRICSMALTRKPQGEDLACELTKTWAKSTLEGGEDKSVKWGFGDAQCRVDLEIDRSDVIALLTRKEHTVQIPAHKVNCTVENESDKSTVRAELAPKLKFKNGKAEKIWVNLTKIEGPPGIKAVVWTAAELEDQLGVFHKSMLKAVNKFLHKQCAERYDANGNPRPESEILAKGKGKKKKGGLNKDAEKVEAEAKVKSDKGKAATGKSGDEPETKQKSQSVAKSGEKKSTDTASAP